MKNNIVIKYDTDHGEVKLSPSIIKKYLVSGKSELVTEQEIVMFLQLCKFQRLNPFLKEAYLIKYSNDNPATMVVGKDTFTKRANKNKDYDGATAGICIKKADGNIENRVGTLLIEGEELIGSWAKVYRKDRKIPVEISVTYSEYEGRKRDGTPNRTWKQKPATMIRKVALVQALREAFPEDFQALYDSAEMSQDNQITEIQENETDKLREEILKLSEHECFEKEEKETIQHAIKSDKIEALENVRDTCLNKIKENQNKKQPEIY